MILKNIKSFVNQTSPKLKKRQVLLKLLIIYYIGYHSFTFLKNLLTYKYMDFSLNAFEQKIN